MSNKNDVYTDMRVRAEQRKQTAQASSAFIDECRRKEAETRAAKRVAKRVANRNK